MPQSTFQPAPVMVIDMTYAFTPLFLGGLIGPIQMARSAYFPARSGNLDQSVSYLDAAAQCPAPLPGPDSDPGIIQRIDPTLTSKTFKKNGL